MKEDENGWGGKHGAPAAMHWHCPECHNNTPVADWTSSPLPDSAPPSDMCRKCPVCGFVFVAHFVPIDDDHDKIFLDHTAHRISGADEPGQTVWHDGTVERNFAEWQKHLAERR
jgi:hypothetical protein